MRSFCSKILIFLVTVACLGCLPTLHPLYTDKDLVFDPALVGRFAEDNGDTWTFEKSGEKGYLLTLISGGKTGTFQVHLLRLDDTLFIDLFPEEPELDANDFYKSHLIPVHTFMRVRAVEPKLEMTMLNLDWLSDQLKKDPTLLKHEPIDNREIVTASTQELQDFIKKNLDNKEAWGDEYSSMTKVLDVK